MSTPNTQAIKGEYFVPTFMLPKLEAQFARLARKAVKCGTAPIVFQINAAVTEERVVGYIPDDIDPFQLNPVTSHFTQINVSGEAPKFNGWRLVARIIFEVGIPIFNVVPGETVPDRFREIGPVCEHCNLPRGRKDTFVVGHDDGTFKAVGTSCLADFLGHADPHQIAELAEMYTAVTGLMACSGEFDDLLGGFNRGVVSVPAAYIVALARVYSLNFGWVTKAQSEKNGAAGVGGVASVVTLSRIAFSRRDLSKEDQKIADACVLTEELMAWAATALKWAAEMTPGSDFEHNINAIARAGRVTNRTFGFACAIVGAYIRQQERTAKEAHNRETTKHVGTVGERSAFDLFLVSTRSFNGNFGVQTLYRFNDEEGNTLIWWTGEDKGLPEGEWIRVNATVKEHGEYRGFLQTSLSHVKQIATSGELAQVEALSDDAKGAIAWATNVGARHSGSYTRLIVREDIKARKPVVPFPELDAPQLVHDGAFNAPRKPLALADFYTADDADHAVVRELLTLGWITAARASLTSSVPSKAIIAKNWDAAWRPDPAKPEYVWDYVQEEFDGWAVNVPDHILPAIKAPKVKKPRGKKKPA